MTRARWRTSRPSRNGVDAGSRSAAGPGSGRPELHGRPPQSALGGRHHTYIPTATGFLYLAVVLDAWSRRIAGWAMATHLRTELVLAALDLALTQRRPREVIRHFDQGCQYTSIAFGQRCRDAGVRPSMGSVGDAYDNAMCDSFFGTLECELPDRVRFATPAEAPDSRMSIASGIASSLQISKRAVTGALFWSAKSVMAEASTATNTYV